MRETFKNLARLINQYFYPKNKKTLNQGQTFTHLKVFTLPKN